MVCRPENDFFPDLSKARGLAPARPRLRLPFCKPAGCWGPCAVKRQGCNAPWLHGLDGAV